MTDSGDAFEVVGFGRFEKWSQHPRDDWYDEPFGAILQVLIFDISDEKSRASAISHICEIAKLDFIYPIAIAFQAEPRQLYDLQRQMPTIGVRNDQELAVAYNCLVDLGKTLSSETLNCFRVDNVRNALGSFGNLTIVQGTGAGPDRAQQAVSTVVENAKSRGCDLTHASGILVIVKGQQNDLSLCDSVRVRSELSAALCKDEFTELSTIHGHSALGQIKVSIFLCSNKILQFCNRPHSNTSFRQFMIKRPPKIRLLFEFLKKNHHINQRIQEGFLAEVLASEAEDSHHALLLLDKMVRTQSKPNLNHIAKFFQAVQGKKKSLQTFNSFAKFAKGLTNEQTLFKALSKSSGWGPKTAALMIRNLALIQQNPHLKAKFWSDLDVMNATEHIHLPVDAVITAIFSRFSSEFLGWTDLKRALPTNFVSINNYLEDLESKNEGKNDNMLIWDDLWFWGFITQRSIPGESNRIFEWNESKYWAIFYSKKDQTSIRKVEELAIRFLELSR